MRPACYLFRTRGLFKPKTKISDSSSNQEVAIITYNALMNKGFIKYKERTITWRFENIWATRWGLYEGDHLLVQYRGRSVMGNIITEEEDDLLILTGLFINNFYRQQSIAILIAVLIPIWATLMN
jgi:hypothetical protein